MTNTDDSKTFIGQATILAFTNTDHYEPNTLGKYWFGCDELEMRNADQQHYKDISIAIVKSHKVGTQYALGMHRNEKDVLISSLAKPVCDLFSDQQQRYFFCVCKNKETKNNQELSAQRRKLKVFVSYSHADSRYVDEGNKNSLLSYLKALEDEGVEFWVDRGIQPGDNWDERIRANIKLADVALVLVSQAFLNSDYCKEVEVETFIQEQRERGLIILPVILSACDWKTHDWLNRIQYLPRDGKNIESHYPRHKRKEIYLEILEELRHCHQRIIDWEAL